LPSISRFNASAGAIAFCAGDAPGAGGSAAKAVPRPHGASAASAPVLRKLRRDTSLVPRVTTQIAHSIASSVVDHPELQPGATLRQSASVVCLAQSGLTS
jgi:hypothetical protein